MTRYPEEARRSHAIEVQIRVGLHSGTVVGEPGVGKARSFHEFPHSHRTQDWLILESGSVSYGKVMG